VPDDIPPPADDWAFPPIEPVEPPLLGWTPEPALPEVSTPEPSVPEPLVSEPSLPEASSPEASVPEPLPAEPAADAAELPPSAPVLPVPRRHPAAAAGPVSPLRALAGAAVAVAGVLLGIGALLWATDAPKGTPALEQSQSSLTAATPSDSAAAPPSVAPSPVSITPSSSPRVSAATVAPAAPKLALTVLNNSNRAGLAKRAAARFAAAGWPIKLTGGFRGRVTATTVYYAPGQQASALALQRAFPAIERVRPRFAGLPGSGLTVVLIRSYPA
jgi:hypothetical protein